MSRRREDQNPDSGRVMTVKEHIRELRNRLIVCFLLIIILFAILYTQSGNIIDLFMKIGISYGYHFVYLSPQEVLMQQIRVSIAGALCLSTPFIIIQMCVYIFPELKPRQMFKLFLYVLSSIICFLIGIYFSYKIMIPFTLKFFIGINKSDFLTASVTLEKYLVFLMGMLLMFGAVAEMPVFTVILTRFRIIDTKKLKNARPYAIVVIFFIAAVITPPDVVSQLMVGIPMVVLYQLCIFLSRVFQIKIKKQGDENNAEH